jgi:hypothetical protein
MYTLPTVETIEVEFDFIPRKNDRNPFLISLKTHNAKDGWRRTGFIM